MKYSCPKCKEPFDKLEEGNCPGCEIKLKAIQEKVEGRRAFRYRYIIDTESNTTPITQEVDLGKLISNPDEIPEIWEVIENEQYRIIYTEAPILATAFWVYCPFCERKLFQNQFLSGRVTQEHKCSRCKVLLQFIFDLPIGPIRLGRT